MTREQLRVVFDTGIFVQAAISSSGPAATALRLVENEAATLFASQELMNEINRVFRYPSVRQKLSGWTGADVEAFLARLEGLFVMIDPLLHYFAIEQDRDDEHVIDLAIAADADYLVARDRDLLLLMNDTRFAAQYPRLQIINPGDFVKKIEMGI